MVYTVYTMILIDQLVDEFHRRDIGFAIAGGYAVVLHGAVRLTVDVDIVVRLAKRDFVEAEAALETIGLLPRLPITASEVFEFREEYIRNRNLVAWSFFGRKDPSLVVDLLITQDLDRLQVVELVSKEGRRYPVVAIDDLIAMKNESGRPQDLSDIDALKRIKK